MVDFQRGCLIPTSHSPLSYLADSRSSIFKPIGLVEDLCQRRILFYPFWDCNAQIPSVLPIAHDPLWFMIAVLKGIANPIFAAAFFLTLSDVGPWPGRSPADPCCLPTDCL